MSTFSLSKRRSSICSRASSLDSACVSDVEERTTITSDDDNDDDDDDDEDDDREEEASKAKFREFS